MRTVCSMAEVRMEVWKGTALGPNMRQRLWVEFHTQERRVKCLQRQCPVTGTIVPRSVVLCPL